MIDELVFLIIAAFSIVSNVFLLLRTNYRIWTLEIWLKRRFPILHPSVCKLVHYLAILYLTTPFICVVVFSLYFGRVGFLLETYYSVFISIFLVRIYVNFLISFYCPAVKWKGDWTSKVLFVMKWVSTWVLQILAGYCLGPFSPPTHTAIFLSFNYLVYGAIDSEEEPGTIDAKAFCIEFTNYLERTVRRQPAAPKNSPATKDQKENSGDSVPSIPNELTSGDRSTHIPEFKAPVPVRTNQPGPPDHVLDIPPIDFGGLAVPPMGALSFPPACAINIPLLPVLPEVEERPQAIANSEPSVVPVWPEREHVISKEPVGQVRQIVESKVEPLVDTKTDLRELIERLTKEGKGETLTQFFMVFLYIMSLVVYSVIYVYVLERL